MIDLLSPFSETFIQHLFSSTDLSLLHSPVQQKEKVPVTMEINSTQEITTVQELTLWPNLTSRDISLSCNGKIVFSFYRHPPHTDEKRFQSLTACNVNIIRKPWTSLVMVNPAMWCISTNPCYVPFTSGSWFIYKCHEYYVGWGLWSI